MSIISGGFPKYSIRDYVMDLSSNGYVLKDVGCGEYATTTAICHGGYSASARMRNIRASAGLPDHPPSSGPRPKKGKGASASAAPPRLEEPYDRWSGGPESPSTPAPRYVNWGPHDRCKKLELRREQDIIDAIRHDSKVAEATAICRKVLLEHGRDTVAPPEMQRQGADRKLEQLSYYQIARSRNLSAAIFPAQAPAGTPRRGLSGPATGEFIYDLDLDVTNVEGLRAACIAWPHTHIVATSVSGDGLWLVLKGPVATTRDQYSAAQRALFRLIPEHIRRHIAENQANLDRLRYISSDPDIFYQPDAPDVPDVDVAVNAEPDQSGAEGESGGHRPKGWPVKASSAREKARKVLQKVKLPDNSHGSWVVNAFSLVDGDRIYGAEFDGRGIFMEWTAAAAYAGSKKPGGADAQYTKAAAAAARPVDPGAPRRTLASLGKGDGKGATQSQPRQDEQYTASAAGNAWIDSWVQTEEVVWWRGRFWRKDGCVWCPESDQFFRHDLQRAIAESRGDPSLRLVSTQQRTTALESLRDAVSPPVVSELLLNPIDYVKNYNLQTGELLTPTAFKNGVVELDPDAPHGFRLVTPAQWDFHSTHRPHLLPQDPPPAPEKFNGFLEYRWPNPGTRLAIRQLIGATLLQRLADENRMVFVIGPGGSGKGTLIRLLVALIGSTGVFTVPNVSRLVSSPFATSQLDMAALLVVSDPTDTARRQNRDALSDGLTIIRNLTGQDDVPIERKWRDQYSTRVNTSVWVNTNFNMADWVTGDEDRDSWKRRIMTIPCQVQLPEDEQLFDYDQRFINEYPSIAWHCIAAYAEMHHTRAVYSLSPEMLDLRAKQIGGNLPSIQKFAAALRLSPDTWTSRKKLRKAYCLHAEVPPISTPTARDLFKAVGALPGVETLRHAEGEGFRGVACP